MAEASLKVKKKKWYPIIAPKLFNNIEIGDIPLLENNEIIGRTVTANLMTLTNNMRNQNSVAKFIITDVQNNRALTKMVGYSMLPTSIKRLVRRGKERITLSFKCKTSDNQSVRIKTLVLPVRKTTGAVSTHLKKAVIDLVERECPKYTFDVLMNEILSEKIQRSLKSQLKKIYPIRVFEIASAEIDEEKTAGEKMEAQEKKTEQPKAEKKEESVEKKDDVKKEEKPAEKKEAKKEEKPKEEKKEEPKKEAKPAEKKEEAPKQEEKPKEEKKEEPKKEEKPAEKKEEAPKQEEKLKEAKPEEAPKEEAKK